MAVFTIVLTALIFVLPSYGQSPRSEAQKKQSASLLSNRIPLFPQHQAMRYLGLYYTTLDRCISENPDHSRSSSRQCVSEAVQQVAVAAEKDNPAQFVRARLNNLRRDGLTAPFQIYPDLSKETLGVVGDSLAIGSMASDYLTPDLFALLYSGIEGLALGWDLTLPEQTDDQKVIRLLNSSIKQYQASLTDCEECSFGYEVGKALGIPASNMFFVAEQGTRVDSMAQQLELLAKPLGYLPEFVIVSYTANDICHTANAEITPQQKHQEYKTKILAQMDLALGKVKPSPKGTEFVFIASADVINVLQNESILNKKISYYFPGDPSDSITCRDLRTQTLQGGKYMANMCPYILGTNLNQVERIHHIDALHSAVVTAQKDAVTALSIKPKDNIRYVFIDDILDVEFTADDISSDCFHPSQKGQSKIADAIIKRIK